MVQDAKEHEAEDAKARELVDARNKFDGMILQAERLVTENKEKINADDLTPIQESIDKAKQDLKDKASDLQGLTDATNEFMKQIESLAKYAQGADQSSDNDDHGNDSNQGPIDVDVE